MKTQVRKKKRGLLHSLVTQKTYWIMLIPAFAYYICFSYLPMTGVWMAFTRYDYASGIFGSPFVGLRNFEFLFGVGAEGGFFHSVIWQLTRNSVLYNLAFILLGNFLQIVVSIMLKELPSKRFRKITQSAMFLPYFISFAIVGVLAYNFLSTHGVINHLLSMIGKDPIDFYQTPKYWPFIIVGVNIWKGIGYGTVIYFATLSGIDETIYEAAYIDGASFMQRILKITIPMLKSTIIVLILFSLGGILKGQFDMFYNLVRDNSLLYSTTDVIDTYVYRAITVSPNLSTGSAAGFYQSVFGLILVLTVNGIVKKIEPEYSLF